MILFRERLTPPPTFHLALLLLLPLSYGMFAPISVAVAASWAVLVFGVAEIWLFVLAPVVTVTETELIAGKARISRSLLADARAIAREDRRDAIHNALSWKLLRGWIPTGITVTITDDADPTPYWFVSTRRPEELAALLNSAA
ncbi:MAG: hypothetical protein RIS25_430 [Actinomycetota bacterium]|jgi:Protein of unknown function (DUF3093)